MNQVVFLLLAALHLAFLYRLMDKMPDECQAFAARLTELLPSFNGERGDLKSFGFCLAVMGFIIGMALVFFR